MDSGFFENGQDCLDFTFEQQIELRIEKLKNELIETSNRGKQNKIPVSLASRLYRSHIYDSVDGYRMQHTRKHLIYILSQLAKLIAKNIKELSKAASSSIRTVTPISTMNTLSFKQPSSVTSTEMKRCYVPTIVPPSICSSDESGSQSRSLSIELNKENMVDEDELIIVDDQEVINIDSSEDDEEVDLESVRSSKISKKTVLSDVHSIVIDNLNKSSKQSRQVADTRDQMSTESCDAATQSQIEEVSIKKDDYLLSLVDRKNISNFIIDSNEVLCMKPIDKIKYKKVGIKSQALMLHVIAKTLKLLHSNQFISKRELYYMSLEFCKVSNRRRKSNQSSLSQPSASNISQSYCSVQIQGPSSIAGGSSISQLTRLTEKNAASTSNTNKMSTRKLDDCIDDLCCLVGCSRIDLHIITQAKGLVYGNLRMTMENGEKCNGLSKKYGVYIPSPHEPIVKIETDAQFVLVIEKDSVMQKILNLEEKSNFIHKYKAILFTAKGYPDMNSRAFIRFLWLKLKLPILVLADADPYGIEIMCCYRFGSYTTAYDSSNLAVPQVRWLGLLPSDIEQMNLPRTQSQPLSNLDERRLDNLSERQYISKRPDIVEQLNVLREFGRKAELECLDSFNTSYIVETYLPDKLRRGSWI